MQLYLVRHPPPDIASGICYGQSDIDVKAPDLAAVLQQLHLLLPPNVPLFSSPLQRCARLASGLHHTPTFDARLMEMHFGAWEMQSWDVISRAEIDAWAADVTAYAPGGGETVVSVANRVIDFMHDLAMHSLADAIIVAHAGTIRLMMAYQPGMNAKALASEVVTKKKTIHFGECIKLQVKLC